MKKFSITKKVSLLLAAFAVCIIAASVSMPVQAAAGPFTLSEAYAQGYDTTHYVYLESSQSFGNSISLTYSTTNPTGVGATTSAVYIGTSSAGKYVYRVTASFAPASTVYLKYQNADAIVAVTAPNNISSLSQTNATANSFTISWPAVAGASGYFIYAGTNENNVALKGDTAATSYTLSGLTKDSQLVCFVYPYKSNGQGFKQSWYCRYKTCVTACGKVSGIKLAASNEYSKKYMISWNEKGATTATGFEIEIRNSKNKKITSATETNYVSHIFTSKKLTTQPWKVRVRAYTLMDNGTKAYGAWSEYKVVVPNATIKSYKLTSKTSTNVKLKWSKVSGAKSYTVYRKTGTGKFKKIATVKGTSYTMKNLAKNKYHYVYVKANKVKFGKKKYNSTSVKSPGYISFVITTKYSYY